MQGSCDEDAQLLIWYPVGSGNLIDMGDTVGRYCHAPNRFCQPPIACSTCGYRNTRYFYRVFCFLYSTYRDKNVIRYTHNFIIVIIK